MSEGSSAGDHAPSVLSRLAAEEHDARVISSWVSIGLGAGLAAWGVEEAVGGDDASSTALLLLGGSVSITGGVLSLFIPEPMERLERELGEGGRGYSPELLEGIWRIKAREARSQRQIAGVTGLCLGGAAIATGAVLAAGVGEMSDDERSRWAIVSFVGGASFTLGGLLSLLTRSTMEKGYELAYPSVAPLARWDVGISPTAGGASLRLEGTF